MVRKELLTMLLACDGDPRDIQGKLSKFGWDSSSELVVLTRFHAVSVLRRYVAGQLGAVTVEYWANAIEGRDDIGLEMRHEAMLKRFVHEMANPFLVGALNVHGAQEWISRLEPSA